MGLGLKEADDKQSILNALIAEFMKYQQNYDSSLSMALMCIGWIAQCLGVWLPRQRLGVQFDTRSPGWRSQPV